MIRARAARTGLAAGLLLAAACSEETPPASAASDAVARGRKIYENVCIACHNGDPAQPGSLGPEIAGASRELLEAKILRAEYPPGYTPVRSGQTMPRYEYLKDRIDDLAEYLRPLQKN